MGVRLGDNAPESKPNYQRGFEAGYKAGTIHALDHVADSISNIMADIVGAGADEGPPVPRADVSAAMHKLIHSTRTAAAMAREVPTD